ncbi:hypothetical protein [Suttonella sp. R2A3]|uniref:hypothetical protein n=1 Tax=Suttonella sp. R2A3 TaxID=2908648 RepID=UPI0038FCAA52
MAATTQNQAFNAIMFLYNDVLGISMKDANIRALRKNNESVYLSCLQELLTLRILHLDFAYKNIRIMDSESIDDRLVPIPDFTLTKACTLRHKHTNE